MSWAVSCAGHGTNVPFHNVLSAIYLISREIGLPARKLGAAFNWEWLTERYQHDVQLCLARTYGISDATMRRSPRVRRALAQLSTE